MSLIQLGTDVGNEDEPGLKQVAAILHDLVNGIVDPESAAEKIDRIIVSDCQEAYLSYTSSPKPTAEQVASGSIRGPDPGGWLQFLWNSFGTAAMVIPYDHAGQDRLVSLIQELQRLPSKKLPWLVWGNLMEKEIYILTDKNGYDGFKQWLWELDQGRFVGQQAKSAEATAAYLNFSSFLARMLAVGIGAGVGLCALTRRPESRFSTQRIAWTAKFADSDVQVKFYQPFAAAAAIWLLYAGEKLFELCNNQIRGFGSSWKRQLWQSWKEKFEEVVEDKRFNESTRSLVRQALERMDHLERGGWIVHKEDDEDEEEREEK